METKLIIRHEHIPAFREACEFHKVEILSESIPETISKKPYPGTEFTLDAEPGSMFYVGKAMERIIITGEL